MKMYDQEKVLSFVKSETMGRSDAVDYLLDFMKGAEAMLIRKPVYLSPSEEAKEFSVMKIGGCSKSNPQNTSQPTIAKPEPIASMAPKKTTRAVCNFCGKSFAHLGDYNKHQRRHTGERPYGCDVCLQRFAHASNLTRHRRLHSGEKPFECPTCAQRFSRKDKLAAHMARQCCKPVEAKG